jgi:hypothetical protein
VLALAVDDEDAPLAASALRAEKLEEALARGFGSESVQIESPVDREHAATELAEERWRYVEAAPFDALAVVRHLEPDRVVDEVVEVVEHGLGFFLRLLTDVGRLHFGRLDARGPGEWDAATPILERDDAAHHAVERELVFAIALRRALLDTRRRGPWSGRRLLPGRPHGSGSLFLGLLFCLDLGLEVTEASGEGPKTAELRKLGLALVLVALRLLLRHQCPLPGSRRVRAERALFTEAIPVSTPSA